MLSPVLSGEDLGPHTLKLLKNLGIGLVDPLGLLLAVLLIKRVATVLGVRHWLTFLIETFVCGAISLYYK